MNYKFKINQLLSACRNTDYDCIVRGKIIKITKCFVWCKIHNETKKCKIHKTDESEYINPEGNHSMCLTFWANDKYIEKTEDEKFKFKAKITNKGIQFLT